ncbi:MAG: transposase DDE domain-containing protein [Promethearchaeota archaeon CR_4]|nr:MAG: transposase DDE domain-containing protein [Candidatus Lokiarchaeota archaeon CR_4]
MQRGDISFYLEFLSTWDANLARANQAKVGTPFVYPDAIFAVACVLRFLFSIPYRSIEGVLRTLGTFAKFPAPCYTTIWRRCRTIHLEEWLPQRPTAGSVTIAVNASDLKVVNSGEWLRKK